MSNYRRMMQEGGTYFFTVNLFDRRGDLLVRHIDILRDAVRRVKQLHPFQIVAWVVLPDHLHCILRLPEDDADFSLRWRLIKLLFCKNLPISESIRGNQLKRKERGVWQRRFWEHMLRNQKDLDEHIHYIHRNPVKHGLVGQVKDWPYSTFHRYVQQNIYDINWCGEDDST